MQSLGLRSTISDEAMVAIRGSAHIKIRMNTCRSRRKIVVSLSSQKTEFFSGPKTLDNVMSRKSSKLERWENRQESCRS